MDTKVVIAVAVVAILAVAGIGTAIALNNKGGSSNPADIPVDNIMDGATLKVLGNANKDNVIDDKDVKAIEKYIEDGVKYETIPIADANNDKKINSDDIDVVKKIIAKEDTTVWHVNYYDIDQNTTMDTQLVSTAFPIKKCIITASTNTAMTMMLLGITSSDVVVGAAYSSLDSKLFGSTFADTNKVTKVNTTATKIEFEAGVSNATSELIKNKQVTAIISDWNKSYLTNWQEFENANVDIVRGASASVDYVVSENTYRTLGLLFGVDQTRVDTIADLNTYVLKAVAQKGATVTEKKAAVASSNTGDVSAGNSDYTALITLAGGEWGLKGYTAADSATIKVKDHDEVFSYNFDYVFHIRTYLGYTAKTPAKISDEYDKYVADFLAWDKTDGKAEYLISGTMPVPLRAAYIGNVLYPELFPIEWVESFHSDYVALFTGATVNLGELTFSYHKDIVA